MKKIKIIKIEVGEAPAGFYRPYLERILPKPLKLNFLSEIEINPILEETFTREILPIQKFAYGKHWEDYYMRDEDKEKFLILMTTYTQLAKKELIKQLISTIYSYQGKDVKQFVLDLLEIKKKEIEFLETSVIDA